MKLNYVFSAPAMLRMNKSTWEVENPERWAHVKSITEEGIHRLRQEVLTSIPGHEFALELLFNAYTEKDMGERIKRLDNFGFENLYADSGGLQIVTAGKKVDDSMKADIYRTQSHAKHAFCFDEIPCGNIEGLGSDSKSNRSNTENKIYYEDRKHVCATKTAHNIREQIETLDSIGATTGVQYIVQGNNYQDMFDWFDDGSKVLTPDHFNRVSGIALADTCIGNGPMESIEMLVAYHLIRKEFGAPCTKNHIHLLGLGSVRRLLPVLYLMNSGLLPQDLTVSFDSTTFSMSYFMGRFMASDGRKVEKDAAAYRQMFHEVWQYFGDIYTKHVPECNEQQFVEHVTAEIRSLAGAINNSHADIEPVVRANITLTNCWQVLGFIKRINKCLEFAKHDNSPMGMLQEVDTFDKFLKWKGKYGHYIASKRIKREGKDLMSWFD